MFQVRWSVGTNPPQVGVVILRKFKDMILNKIN